MVYISDLTKITETKYKIGNVHYMPFDLQYGLKKSKEELLLEGKLFDTLPKKLNFKVNAIQDLYYNPIENNLFYDYIEVENHNVEQPVLLTNIQEQNKSLTQQLSRVLISSKKSETMLFKQINTLNIEMNKLKKEGN